MTIRSDFQLQNRGVVHYWKVDEFFCKAPDRTIILMMMTR